MSSNNHYFPYYAVVTTQMEFDNRNDLLRLLLLPEALQPEEGL